MSHAIVRTDKLWGTDVRSGMVSFKAPAEIDNGCVVTLGGLAGSTKLEREVYSAAQPTASDDFDAIVLVATPEVNTVPGTYAIENFVNKQDSIARGYRLHKGDIFSVTEEALTAADFDAVAADDVVELQAGYKLNVASAATSGSTVVGKILDVEVAGGKTFYVVEVTA